MLYHEKKRKADLLKDNTTTRKVTKELRTENPDLNGHSENLTKLIAKMIQRSGVSYPDSKKAFTCVYWWTHGV